MTKVLIYGKGVAYLLWWVVMGVLYIVGIALYIVCLLGQWIMDAYNSYLAGMKLHFEYISRMEDEEKKLNKPTK